MVIRIDCSIGRPKCLIVTPAVSIDNSKQEG